MLKKLFLSLCLAFTGSCTAMQSNQIVPRPTYTTQELPRPNLAAMTAPVQSTLNDQLKAAGRHELFNLQSKLHIFRAPLTPQQRDELENLIDQATTAQRMTNNSGSLSHAFSKTIERALLVLNRP